MTTVEIKCVKQNQKKIHKVILSLGGGWVSSGPLRNKRQNRISCARNLLERILVRVTGGAG
jgi:hypothetical protein